MRVLMRRGWKIAGALLVLFLAYWGSTTAWDYYKLLSGQTPMFDVAIKLQVGDELGQD
ncbi:MAG: hypothetical protein K9G33_10530 [Sneathiella sp.]|nr:hypothetical protein [Sneathiella sp.]